MNIEPRPHLPRPRCRPGGPSVSRGDGFAGGCISLIVLLIEIPVAVLLGLLLSVRGWGRADEQSGAPAMDWVPVLWLGGFTLGVLVVAVAFLRSAHPYAGAVQLLIAAMALLFAITAWHEEYERAHPAPLPTCPTRAGTPCAPPDPVTDR
ncbi:hypothetical protein QFZ55_001734 [Streptomyces luteogriseus]|nr:DUF6234 family protein [Streptomyces luteogriseus]MDQ0712282.1 hypothetical protein [Streptomyces luteogriseus]